MIDRYEWWDQLYGYEKNEDEEEKVNLENEFRVLYDDNE